MQSLDKLSQSLNIGKSAVELGTKDTASDVEAAAHFVLHEGVQYLGVHVDKGLPRVLGEETHYLKGGRYEADY